jgi:predicted DNA-binding transcriptional regulator AlpA
MAAPSRQIYTLSEVIDATGISEDSIRREMKKSLPSRFQNGRRRFLRGDVESWFQIGDAVKTAPVKSFTPVRVTHDVE